MLKFMRKYASGYLVKALFGVIILVFIFWGVGSFRERDTVVAQVGPYKVTATEYREAYDRMMNFYRMLYKEKFDENVVKELKLREKAMDQLVDQYILLLKAKEMGLKVTDREFADYLARVTAFQRDGKFDPAVYAGVLKRNNLDSKKFEESERKTLLITKVANILGDVGGSPNDAEIWARYVKERGRINLSVLAFDPADYMKKVTVSDTELSDTYEKEKNQYKSEAAYHLKQVVVDPKSPMKDDALYLELLKVKDPDAYARQKGFEVVDLGTLKESDLLKRFKGIKLDQALKGLKKGEISLPVRDGTRSYIFVLTDSEEGKLLDKATVTKEIQEKLKREKAKQMAKASAEDAISKKTVEGKKETGFIPRNSPAIPGIGPVPKDNAGILTLSEKTPLYEKPVEIGGKFYVFSFKGEKAPDTAEWEKEKMGFKQFLMGQTREEMLKSVLADTKKKEKVTIKWEDI
jgi:peptidyl-prolyl cis-trans isomerase D